MIHLALWVASALFLGWLGLHLVRGTVAAFTPAPKQPITRDRWNREVAIFGKSWTKGLYRVVPDQSPELHRPAPWWIVAD